MPLQMVTANRLADGAVVYLTAAGGWSQRCEDGRIADDADAAGAMLASAETAQAACVVVAPYLIDVIADQGPPRPQRYRERIRADGPSIRFGAGVLAERR